MISVTVFPEASQSPQPESDDQQKQTEDRELQLIAAAIIWTVAEHVTQSGLEPSVMSSIVSLSGGAMVANIVSVTIVVTETLMMRR